MTTSNQYSYDPILGSLFQMAFSRIGVKRTELLPSHMDDARNEANLLQVKFVNEGVLLFTQDIQTIPLVQGTATYNVPLTTVMILDLYIQTPSYNRLLMPFSRTDLASLANPTQQGFPTSFFFLRTQTPTITFWPVPDGTNTYTCNFWRYRQQQDAVPEQGGNAEITYLFLDAYVSGLAHRLSRMYAPALEAQRKVDADEAFAVAMKQNTENVPIYLTPGLMGYYRT